MGRTVALGGKGAGAILALAVISDALFALMRSGFSVARFAPRREY